MSDEPRLVETKDRYTFDELLEIMERLLAPDGCPWDREQTLSTLKRYLLEETYEVLDTIERGDPDAHREELGDLLFQVVFQSAIRQREGEFAMADVVTAIAQKLVRRHPHVFGNAHARDAGQVKDQWGRLKEAEAARKRDGSSEPPPSVLDGIPTATPGLLRARQMQEKVANVGFDWQAPGGARDKMAEELGELDEAVTSGDQAAIQAELGDLLLTVVNYARLLGIDATDALRGAMSRFEHRWRYVESGLRAREQRAGEATLDEMEALWQAAKREEGER